MKERFAAMFKFKTFITPYLFILPFVLLFLAFVVAPLFYAVYLSFYREAMIGGTIFVGLGNFSRALTDPRFWYGLTTMLKYGIFVVPFMVAMATLLALVLDTPHVPARQGFRLIFFLPYAVPSVIAALIWSVMYGPVFGPITQIANFLHLPPPPLLTEKWILFALGNIAVWELVGYKMVIVFAALKTVPPDLEEAAAIDGANAWQYAWHVKVPLVIGAILLNTIFSIIQTLQLFNEPMILQTLAPGVVTNNFTPNMYARSIAFTAHDIGYAGALSFMLAAAIAILSSIVFVVSRRKRKA